MILLLLEIIITHNFFIQLEVFINSQVDPM